MASTRAPGATIRIFLVDGTPQGLRVVDRVGWTGSCLAFARSDYAAARARPEVSRTGAYVLVGPDLEGHRTHRAYVGEADEVRSRLDAHQKEKDFWTHGYVLTTKDDSLNKAHVRYLEARLLATARRADNAVLDNGTAPTPIRLTEHEEADMESYLGEILILLPLVGVNVFDIVAETQAAQGRDDPLPAAAAAPSSKPRLRLATQLTQAEGREDARGFLVFEGALARRQAKKMIKTYEQLRARLIAEGVLVEYSAEQLRLTKNFVFDSLSAAASVLSGGSKNGRSEWRDAAGRTLKALQAASAD